MDYASDKKVKIFLKGAAIGITGSILLMLGKEITKILNKNKLQNYVFNTIYCRLKWLFL